MAITYSYTVEGTGTFPTDMLRYDHCWPSSSECAAEVLSLPPRPTNPEVIGKAREIVRALEGKPALLREVLRQLVGDHDHTLWHERRQVRLSGIIKPTDARWDSFGWSVVGKVERNR